MKMFTIHERCFPSENYTFAYVLHKPHSNVYIRIKNEACNQIFAKGRMFLWHYFLSDERYRIVVSNYDKNSTYRISDVFDGSTEFPNSLIIINCHYLNIYVDVSVSINLVSIIHQDITL